MAERQPRERPSSYDGTQFVIFVDLPSREWTTSDLYEYVYGVRLNDGAKPWPYFRDAQTKQWWSLSNRGKNSVDSLAWMIDLDQLAYRPFSEAQTYLETVLTELKARAAQFGGTAEAESSVQEALTKMGQVGEMLKIRDYRVMIVVAAPDGGDFGATEWWQALEGVSLKYGDGDLFWFYNEAFTRDGSDPNELFCAEPHSVPGYFHAGDCGSKVRFPDVALHFRARDVADPITLLRRMVGVAEQLVARLGGILLTEDGQPFKLVVAEARLRQVMNKLQMLQASEQIGAVNEI